MSDNEIYELAASLMQNPDPFLRLSIYGKAILKNPAAEKLTEFYHDGNKFKAAEFWRFIAKKGDYIYDGSEFEINADSKVYSFVCKYFPLSGYFNLYGRDVTLQKQKESDLYRLSLLAETNESGVLYNNAAGEILWVNEAFCKLVGYPASEIIGKKSLDFCKGPLTDNGLLSSIAASIGKAQSFNRELIHYRKDGSWFWGRVRGKAFHSAGTHELQYFALVDDITLEKEKEERLEVLSQIAETNVNAVVITDNRGRITWVNTSFTNMTGYSLEEAAGKKPGRLLQGPDTDPTAIEYLRTQIKAGKSFNTEIYNYSKTGKPYWLRIQGQPFFNSNNELSGFFAIQENITSEKAIEDTLRANEEKYRNIITNMKLGLLEVDNDEKITYANKSFCEMSGYALPELLGKKARALLTNSKTSRLLEEKLARRKQGLSDAYEVMAIDKRGETRWWFVSGAPRYNDKGELLGSIGIHLDITEQKKLEHELIEARINAEQLARTKELFLANMSHEIRTPMNAIMGMSSQLAKTNLAPQQQFYLDIIHSASENLLVIINDILDLSKIEAGRLSLENIGFQPKAIITRSMRVLVHKAEEKGIILANSHFDKDIAPVLLGDPHRLTQVLLNLMSNAVKFTEKGSVDLHFNLVKNKKDSQVIQVTVKDTGIGMDKVFIDSLFEKFSQEYESVTRTYGGTGLGMSICKELIELMGGNITAESKKGVGTTISFVLEFRKGSFDDLPQKVIFQENSDFLAGKNVLIADDNEMNRLVASIFVENYGARVIHAGNGVEAIEEFEKQIPDVILMDIQMPAMNGFDATRIIREKHKEIPIIALTANAIKGENEKCIAAGMNDYVSKPFKEEDLLKTIAKWLGEEVNVVTIGKNGGETPDEQLYDLSTLRDISRGNDAFVEKMVNIFCDQTPPMLREMTIAMYDNDLERMGAIAHRIKPSIDNLNINSLKQTIRTIEKMGYEKTNSPDLPDLLKEVDVIIERVLRKMKQEYQIQQN
jgi:PAS domain S-box-containing protein